MDTLVTICVGVLSGVFSSALFFFLLRQLRPQIQISPHIAKVIVGKHTYYDFKIINTSSRAAIDIHAYLVLAKSTNVEGGAILKTEGIQLTNDRFFELGAFSSKDQNAYYALRFTTIHDIDNAWVDDTTHLRLRIMATDSESGFSRAFMKDFRVKRNSIKTGQHEFGKSLAVT